MKLIHCADIHLDAAFANFDPERARLRRAEILETFCKMIDYAAANGVDAVLIAGDLFDAPKQVRKRTLDRVREAVAANPGLQFCYLPGNHDGGTELYRNAVQPANFHTFGARWSSVEVGEVTVTAAGKPNPDTLLLRPDALNIVMLHGNAVETLTVSKSEDIPVRAYAGRNIDYLALGHIHSHREGKVDERCRVCYCGCPEGRGFDECGEKGFCLLETTPDRRLTVSFVPFAARILHDIRVDLSGCTAQAELESRVSAALSGIPRTDLVKLTLTGAIDPVFTPEFSTIDRDLEDRFWFARRADETTPLIRPEDYRNDISLKGEFIRLAMAADLSTEDRDRVILNGLRALYGEEPDL